MSRFIILHILFILFLNNEAFSFSHFSNIFTNHLSHEESRIVNGTNAEEGEFPFAVSLRRGDSHTCGGTIINEKYILTAAHCVCSNDRPLNTSLYNIQYGLTKITKEPVNIIGVDKIICNNFTSEKLVNDCAVLKLKESLPKSNNWRKVEISKKFDTSKEQKGIIIGWGRISHGGPIAEDLQKLEVDIYDDETCGDKHDIEHHICFGAKQAGACNGDSGTALLVNGKQVGIASFISSKCGIADKEFPNVYSRIPTYFEWIQNIIENTKNN